MSPHDLNIRHLSAHVAIVATGSVSEASRRIHLSQPAVTQAIAKLERQLGTNLFVRSRGGMQATEAGRLLARRAEAVLRLVGTRLATAAQLRAFLALTRAGSYPAAAAESGLSEASLHRAVADLGVTLGAPLLARQGRSLALTTRGRDAVRRFGLAIAEIESAIIELEALQGRETGRIAVGAMPLSRSRLLPRAITAFHAAHPDVAICVVEGSHAELVGSLRDGHVTMMIGALRDDPAPDLAGTALFHDAPIIVGRPGHPLGRAGELSGPSLASFSWIVPGKGAPLRALWHRMFDSLAVDPPPVRIECGSVIAIRELLAGSDQLALLSPDQVALELETGRLEQFGRAPGSLDRVIGVMTRRDWRPTPVEERLLALLAKAADDCGTRRIRKNR